MKRRVDYEIPLRAVGVHAPPCFPGARTRFTSTQSLRRKLQTLISKEEYCESRLDSRLQETRVNSHLPQSRISRNSAVGDWVSFGRPCSSYTTGTLFLLGETECTPQRRTAAGTWLPCCLLRKVHLDESIRFKLAVSALPFPRSLAITRFGATVLYEDQGQVPQRSSAALWP